MPVQTPWTLYPESSLTATRRRVTIQYSSTKPCTYFPVRFAVPVYIIHTWFVKERTNTFSGVATWAAVRLPPQPASLPPCPAPSPLKACCKCGRPNTATSVAVSAPADTGETSPTRKSVGRRGSTPKMRASLAARVCVFPVPAPAVRRIAGVSRSRRTTSSCPGSRKTPGVFGYNGVYESREVLVDVTSLFAL